MAMLRTKDRSKGSVRTRQNYSKQIVSGDRKGNEIILGTVVKEQEKQDHEYCLRCGRRLRNKKAREIGYGAVCIKKLRYEENKPLFESGHNLQSSQKEKSLN